MTVSEVGDAAMAAIVGRISGRMEEIVRPMVERYRAEIVDYRKLEDEILFRDVHGITLENFRALLANLERGEILEPDQLERVSEGAARRVHQGVSLESLLHAYRLWGQGVWEAILAAARTGDAREREAALRIAGRVIQHIDLVSTVAAQAYLDEAQGVWSDREVLRRDLLEALLSGQAESEPVRYQASLLRLDLREHYVVIVVRGPEPDPQDGERGSLSARAALRHVVDIAKFRLRPPTGSLLVGIRQGDVVALYPLAEPAGLELAQRECLALAREIARRGFSVGIGSWHPGLGAIADSYAEACEAVDSAVSRRQGTTGPAGSDGPSIVCFDEIIIEHILRSSPRSDRLLGQALERLHTYDREHSSALVATLRAYLRSGFNLTRSAAALHVHPNTVVYRLKRIRELTGRDPNDPDDLLLLSLGLRLQEGSRAG